MRPHGRAGASSQGRTAQTGTPRPTPRSCCGAHGSNTSRDRQPLAPSSRETCRRPWHGAWVSGEAHHGQSPHRHASAAIQDTAAPPAYASRTDVRASLETVSGENALNSDATNEAGRPAMGVPSADVRTLRRRPVQPRPTPRRASRLAPGAASKGKRGRPRPVFPGIASVWVCARKRTCGRDARRRWRWTWMARGGRAVVAWRRACAPTPSAPRDGPGPCRKPSASWRRHARGCDRGGSHNVPGTGRGLMRGDVDLEGRMRPPRLPRRWQLARHRQRCREDGRGRQRRHQGGACIERCHVGDDRARSKTPSSARARTPRAR